MAKLHNASRFASHAMCGGHKFILLCIGLATLLGGCGKIETPQPQPPEVTVLAVEPKDTPVTFEFVGSSASSQQVEVRAPVTGASSFARIQNGAYVNAQSGPLTYVVQLDPIRVNFSLSGDELLKFRQEKKSGQLLVPETAALTVELVLSDGSIYPDYY